MSNNKLHTLKNNIMVYRLKIKDPVVLHGPLVQLEH